MQTITRKFLVKHVPDITGKNHWVLHRFYIYRKNGIVIRVQSNGDMFELERKSGTSDLIRNSEKIVITKEEFESIGKIAQDFITRDSYLISDDFHIVLHVYHGRFEGLVRVEVEFQSIEQAKKFIPFQWMGNEITSSPLAKDEMLLDLTDDKFRKLL